MPKSRLEFWQPKLAGNVARDARIEAELRAMGWGVIVIWECETASGVRLERLVNDLRKRPNAPVGSGR